VNYESREGRYPVAAQTNSRQIHAEPRRQRRRSNKPTSNRDAHSGRSRGRRCEVTRPRDALTISNTRSMPRTCPSPDVRATLRIARYRRFSVGPETIHTPPAAVCLASRAVRAASSGTCSNTSSAQRRSTGPSNSLASETTVSPALRLPASVPKPTGPAAMSGSNLEAQKGNEVLDSPTAT